MRIPVIIISVIFFALSNCTWMHRIEREIKPAEKYDIQINKDDCAILKGNNYEVAVEIIDNSHIEMLLASDHFVNSETESSTWRTPKLHFLHVVITNYGNYPININKIKLKYGDIEKEPLSIQQIKKECKSPVYSIFNFDSILSSRRLLGKEFFLKKTNFYMDTIEYKLNFINPGDIVSRIIAFDWIPVEYRHFNLIAIIESHGMEKAIDFAFRRLEYRSEGCFKKPRKEEPEEEPRE